jgi:hypothetical protein
VLDVRPLLGEIALGFENGPANQRVEAAAHFRHPTFEIEGRKLRAELIGQQLPEIGLDLVMAWFSRKMAQKTYRGRSDHRSKIAAASELDNRAGANAELSSQYSAAAGPKCGPGPASPKPRSEPYTGVSRHGKERSAAGVSKELRPGSASSERKLA